MKLNPQVFKYVLRKLEVKSEETLFIGDNVETDYAPATKLGLRSVLICRAGINTKTRRLRVITGLSKVFGYID